MKSVARGQGRLTLPGEGPGGSASVDGAKGRCKSQQRISTMDYRDNEGPIEIAFVGDLTDNEGDLTEKLLAVQPGGECTLFFDSPGGSPYCAISLMSVIRLRGLRATGIVTGECS